MDNLATFSDRCGRFRRLLPYFTLDPIPVIIGSSYHQEVALFYHLIFAPRVYGVNLVSQTGCLTQLLRTCGIDESRFRKLKSQIYRTLAAIVLYFKMPYQCLIGFLSAFLSLQSIILQGFLENLQRIFQGFLCFPLNRFDVNAYALLLPILRSFIEHVSMKYIHILYIEEPLSNLLHWLLCMCERACMGVLILD